MKSRVEEIFLKKSGYKLKYEPTEKIGNIVVNNYPELGKLTALLFLEWVQYNPSGVISLPTGKTPEYFIKEVIRFLNGWDQRRIDKELEDYGLDPSKKPDLKGLHFVQIDEFYPINPHQHNSFYHFVNKFYIDGFGLDPKKALFINCSEIGLPDKKTIEEIWPCGKIDITLRYRHAENNLEKLQKKVIKNIDQWCTDYEEKIRSLGGIGFFLGGIGPDGHIGFNIKGSDLYSTTRLTPTNYETQAASAQDLGGIEVAKTRLVITIGLATITYNPLCTAIIIAAGETKAKIVADSIQNQQSILYPATVLQKLPSARFFITKGAAKLLKEHEYYTFVNKNEITEEQIEKIIVDLSLELKKPISKLKQSDFKKNSFAKELLKRNPDGIEALSRKIIDNLKQRINAGSCVRKNKIILHTEPHHDDIMLGYLPWVVRNIREHKNKHFFATLTSGFTSVTNKFMLNLMVKLRNYLDDGIFDELLKDDYFNPNNTIGKNRDIWQYLDGVAAHSTIMKDEGLFRRLLRNLIFIYEEKDIDSLKNRTDELINYFKTQYPGKKDLVHIQRLKGMCREWEGDCLWGYLGWHSDSIFHLRLGFYQGDIFNEEPTVERDVTPILKILRKINPDIISIALDPESSGPDTHYKVLQATTEALKLYAKEANRTNIEVWGYRNVWYRFHPGEVNIYVPVSLNMFALQDNAFKNAFLSQRDASFPSYDYDGPFSELAQKIQVEQYQMLKTCLGRKYFNEHKSALIRATRGMVFLKKMDLNGLYQHSLKLKKQTENL